MDWISVKDRLPDLFEIVWIYWRDREVLLGCRTALDSDPEGCWWSFEDQKCRYTYWWMAHKDHPCEAPDVPNAPPRKMSDQKIVFKQYKSLIKITRNNFNV